MNIIKNLIIWLFKRSMTKSDTMSTMLLSRNYTIQISYRKKYWLVQTIGNLNPENRRYLVEYLNPNLHSPILSKQLSLKYQWEQILLVFFCLKYFINLYFVSKTKFFAIHAGSTTHISTVMLMTVPFMAVSNIKYLTTTYITWIGFIKFYILR